MVVRLPYTHKGSGSITNRRLDQRYKIMKAVYESVSNNLSDAPEIKEKNFHAMLRQLLSRTDTEVALAAARDSGLIVKQARLTLSQQARISNSMSRDLFERLQCFLKHELGVKCDHKGALANHYKKFQFEAVSGVIDKGGGENAQYMHISNLKSVISQVTEVQLTKGQMHYAPNYSPTEFIYDLLFDAGGGSIKQVGRLRHHLQPDSTRNVIITGLITGMKDNRAALDIWGPVWDQANALNAGDGVALKALTGDSDTTLKLSKAMPLQAMEIDRVVLAGVPHLRFVRSGESIKVPVFKKLAGAHQSNTRAAYITMLGKVKDSHEIEKQKHLAFFKKKQESDKAQCTKAEHKAEDERAKAMATDLEGADGGLNNAKIFEFKDFKKDSPISVEFDVEKGKKTVCMWFNGFVIERNETGDEVSVRFEDGEVKWIEVNASWNPLHVKPNGEPLAMGSVPTKVCITMHHH